MVSDNMEVDEGKEARSQGGCGGGREGKWAARGRQQAGRNAGQRPELAQSEE